MAVTMESFSIREYVGRMREVDRGKCWPWEGEGKLPPMEVRRCRWWADEVEVVRKRAEREGEAVEEGGEDRRQARGVVGRGKQRAPKKRSIVELFAVAPPVEAMEVEEDEDGAGGSGSDDRVEVEDEERGAGVEGCGQEKEVVAAMGDENRVGCEGLGTPRKRKERVKEEEKKSSLVGKKKIIKDLSISKKNKRKKKHPKKKKMFKIDSPATRKEKVHNHKVHRPTSISRLLDSAHKSQAGKSSNGIDRTKKKTSVMKRLATKQTLKLTKASKLACRKQDVLRVLPVHSILKNRSKSTSVRKASMKGEARGSNLLRLCRGSQKHVSFSGKDDILGQNISFSTMELPQLQSLCRIFSDVLAASSALENSTLSDNIPPATERTQAVNGTQKDTSINFSDKTVGQLHRSEQLTAANDYPSSRSINLSNGGCSGADKSSLAESLDLNYAVQSFNSGSSTSSPSESFSGKTTGQVSVQNEGLNSKTEIHAEESSHVIQDARRSLPRADVSPFSRSEALSSKMISRSPSLKQSASCLGMTVETNRREQFPSAETVMNGYNSIPEFQPTWHVSSDDLTSNICPSPVPKKFVGSRIASDPAFTFRDKCMRDFIGLPLNSHGELIHMDSSNSSGFSDLSRRQNTVLSSHHDLSLPKHFESNSIIERANMKGKSPGVEIYQKDQLSWPPGQYFPVTLPALSGSGFTEMPGFERMNVQPHEPVKGNVTSIRCDENLVEFSLHGSRKHGQTHSSIHGEKSQTEQSWNGRVEFSVQPTMRLMGKNVTVGKNSQDCRAFDDGKVWTDKEIVTEQCPTGRVPDKSLPKWWPQQEWITYPASGTYHDSPSNPLEGSSSSFRITAIDPRPDNLPFDCRARLMPRDAHALATGNHDPNLVPVCRLLPPQALVNKASTILVNCNSGSGSGQRAYQIPVVVSHPQNFCQPMLLNSTHCKHSQSVSYSMTSSFQPQVLRQDYQISGIAQPSSAHSSSNLPQWLQDATQQKGTQRSSSISYSDSVAEHHSSSMSGTNFSLFPSSHSRSNSSLPVYNFDASQAGGSYTPVSAIHPFLGPDFTAKKSISQVSATYNSKIKSRDVTKPKFSGHKEPDHVNTSRKRPTVKDDGPMMSMKKPRLVLNGDRLAGSRKRDQFRGFPRSATEPLELPAYGNETSNVGHTVINVDKTASRIASKSSMYKIDGLPRSGPLKLSAGAKHILKPSHNIDQDKCRPTHSTIPFAIGSASGKASMSQKKVAEIYRF